MSEQSSFTAVHSALAQARLRSLARTYRDAAALPAAVLWVHATVSLPEMAAFYASLGWLACGALTLALLWRARLEGLRLSAALPERTPLAHLWFAPGRPAWAVSEILAYLSAASAMALWIQAAAPGLLSRAVVDAAVLVWPAATGARLIWRHAAPL